VELDGKKHKMSAQLLPNPPRLNAASFLAALGGMFASGRVHKSPSKGLMLIGHGRG